MAGGNSFSSVKYHMDRLWFHKTPFSPWQGEEALILSPPKASSLSPPPPRVINNQSVLEKKKGAKNDDGNKKKGKCRNKRLWDLEVEEVKGLMDLGFSFQKEGMSPELMSVLPGLHRLNSHTTEDDDDDDEEEENSFSSSGNEEEDDVKKPYVSEAWFIIRRRKPLLNLRSVSSPAEMKRHLRFWATTVASSIH